MNDIFKRVRTLINDGEFDKLQDISITKPSHFNWSSDVFEGINVAELPNSPALIWTNGETTHTYSFGQLAGEMNKLLNFLRKHGVAQNDVMLLQMALLPHNWVSILAASRVAFE